MWVSAQTPLFAMARNISLLVDNFWTKCGQSSGYPQPRRFEKIIHKTMWIVHNSSTGDSGVSNGFSTEKSLICV